MGSKFYVYMIRCKDDSLYTGYTNNVQDRFRKHEEGKGAKYTRGRGPLTLVYSEEFPTKEAAMSREYALKQLTKKEKHSLITTNKEKGVENIADPE